MSADSASGFDTSSAERWFPNFCRTPVVFSLMVLAQLVVLVMWLSPAGTNDNFRQLGIASVFGQWVILLCAVTLCKLRGALERTPVITGLSLAYGLILAIVAVATLAAVSADRFAGLGLTDNEVTVSRLIQTNVLIAALVAAAALRYYYIQQQWRAGVQAQSDAQIRALQARIRPHFLFNSMNTIASLIRTRPKVAEEAVLNLCDLFRAALANAADDSTLGQELILCQRYMEIEQLRLGDRLEVTWEIDSLPKRQPLPSLILQPLVENAVYHGIQPMPEGGEVKIAGQQTDGYWSVSIDNPKAAQPASHGEGNQIALDNIRQRLAHRYSGNAKLHIESTDSRFRATVKVPMGKTS
ncbi:MAG: sensor histidine kinase [Lysobacterales bacterium]